MQLRTNIIHIILVVCGLFAVPAAAQNSPSCPEHSTEGRDFWAAFLVNGGDQRPQSAKLTILGDTACTVTLSNPLTSWSQTVNLTAHSSVTVDLPNNAIPTNYSITESNGFHITSTSSIQLVAWLTQLASTGATSVLPTQSLGTRYIVLDYPADPRRTALTGATAIIVATQPVTTIQYTPPCPLHDSPSSAVGTPVTHFFNSAGETLLLMANGANTTLSGMEITSDKPIAVFQGNQITSVPHGSPSSDFMYDQSLPVDQWGTTFGLVPTYGRTVGDRIRVVADSACTITLSTGSSFSIADHGVYEFDLFANTPCILTADKPVSVGLCSKGSDYNAEPGDGSLLVVPAIEKGICHAVFTTFTTQRIHTWYLTAITDQPSTMTLDGNNIASQFSPIGSTGYSYTRINVTSGTHSLGNSQGIFSAWTYGVGNVESYLYSLGQSLDSSIIEPIVPPEIHRDTTYISDSVCEGHPYNENGFNIGAEQTSTSGAWTFMDSTVVDDTIVHYRELTLTVLPTTRSEETRILVAGDTLIYYGDTLTIAGEYTITDTTANGCDHIITLHLRYQDISLSASSDGLCPGESVTLTAEGTHTYQWDANPTDSSLLSQQGQNPVTVHPDTTTVYSLLDASGIVIASVTVHVDAPPIICIERNRTFIDFDHPVLALHDCSENRHHTAWDFNDGYHLIGERARRVYHHPLPDTVTVTMTTCTKHNCCADTTLGFVPKIRSIWFPNIFFPDQESNNRFGCYTSYEVAEFELEIFNRWGFFVWSTTDIDIQWDGTHEGEPMPQDAYVYKWFLKDIYGDHKTGVGTVTLVR